MVSTKKNNINERPKVSVGLPIYNGEKTVGRALNHILTQNYTNYELLISDNASTDNTESICRIYEQKHKEILNIFEFQPFRFAGPTHTKMFKKRCQIS